MSASAGRALGYLRYKLRFLKECRCATFTKLYSSCVCPIMDYASGVWVYGSSHLIVWNKYSTEHLDIFLVYIHLPQ